MISASALASVCVLACMCMCVHECLCECVCHVIPLCIVPAQADTMMCQLVEFT